MRYFAAGEPVVVDEPVHHHTPDLYLDHPRVRRILTRFRPGSPLYVSYLHWGDGTDLRALDDRVAAGEAVEADLAGAIDAEVSRYRHHTCGTLFKILTYANGFRFTDDLERFRAHPRHRVCPLCGITLFAVVFEFLEILSVEDERKWRSELMGRIALGIRAQSTR